MATKLVFKDGPLKDVEKVVSSFTGFRYLHEVWTKRLRILYTYIVVARTPSLVEFELEKVNTY